MKLQQRFVLSTVVIFIISLIVGFILANIIYMAFVRENVDNRYFNVLEIMSEEVEEHDISFDQASSFLHSMSDLGYQIALVDEDGKQFFYGNEFDEFTLNDQMLDLFNGAPAYHGVNDFKGEFFMMSHFSNNIQNTVGKVINISGKQYAMFLRTNNTSFFTEFHLVIFGFIFAIFIVSIIGILIISRKIIRSLSQLTKATKHIANHQFDYQLTINGKDEIGELADSFRTMQQKLANNDKTRKKFMNNVSHDFQSPLLNIQGYSELLDSHISTEDGKQFNEIIRTESRRLSNLTKQLLVLTSIDEGTYPIQKQPVRIDLQLHEVIRPMLWRIEEKQLEIAFTLDPVTIQADKNLLMNCWENLISNAIKYNNENGYIKIHCFETDEYAIVTIEDGGIGLDETASKQIFDRFYRVDKARNKEGMGLGLSIVHEVLQYHNGKVEIQSEINKGSKFTIKIPKYL